nr:putative transposase, MuDR, plant, MULE transposase domain protein [Ipomoea batatas]
MSSRRVLGLDRTPNYVGEDEFVFTIKLYHGGVLVVHPYLDYLGGKVEYFDYWAGDHGSMLGLRQMIKSLRYDDRKVQFWYKYGDCTPLKIRRLDRDKDVIDLNFEIPKNKEVEIIVEHLDKENWNYDVNVDYYIDERVEFHDNSKELEVESQKYASDGRKENHFGAINITAIEENQFGARYEEQSEMDYVISEDELRSLSSDSETESAKPSLVYREGDVKKPGFQWQSSQQVQQQINRDENSISMEAQQFHGYQNSVPMVVQQVQQQFYGDQNL